MHNYAIKIRNREKRRVQMQDTGMHLQLREQQLKTISYTYRLLYQNFRITANQKSTIDTQRKINSNTTLKIVIKPQEERTRGEGKKKEQQKQIQSN